MKKVVTYETDDYNEADEKFFDRCAVILEKGLGDTDFVRLSELMDGDPGDQLLDAINSRLTETHPELFCTKVMDKKEAVR